MERREGGWEEIKEGEKKGRRERLKKIQKLACGGKRMEAEEKRAEKREFSRRQG